MLLAYLVVMVCLLSNAIFWTLLWRRLSSRVPFTYYEHKVYPYKVRLTPVDDPRAQNSTTLWLITRPSNGDLGGEVHVASGSEPTFDRAQARADRVHKALTEELGSAYRSRPASA
jgi:hypothetical protein